MADALTDHQFLLLSNILEKIEKEDLTEMDKVKLLLEHQRDFYKELDLEDGEGITITAYERGDDDDFKKAALSLQKAASEADGAFTNHPLDKEAGIFNMVAISKFYKDRYERIAAVYKPFFETSFKLLQRVSAKIELSEDLDSIIDENKRLKEKVIELEQRLEDQANKYENVSQVISKYERENSRQKEAHATVLKWAAEALYSERDDTERKLLLALLLKPKSTYKHLILPIGRPNPIIKTAAENLIANGMILKESVGREVCFELNAEHLEKINKSLADSDLKTNVDKMLRDRLAAGGLLVKDIVKKGFPKTEEKVKE